MTAVETGDPSSSVRAYEQYREAEGPDPGLLSHVAALILERAAQDDDEALRKAAFAQLRLAGSKARGALERLSEKPNLRTRAHAFELLALLGDRGAKQALRGWLEEEDPEVVRAAVVSLDAQRDTVRLLALCRHTASAVREAAARRLTGAAPDEQVRASLAEIARVDPAPAVRSQAVRTLGLFGSRAAPAIRERLSDSESRVRMAAVRALVAADRELALVALTPLLEIAPSPEGIEAARSLAQQGQDGPARGALLASAYLKRALDSQQASHRAQAGVALGTLAPDPALDRVLLQALENEVEAQVRLSLANAMQKRPATRDPALLALRALLQGEGMPALQAAVTLAREGDDAALRKLLRAMRRGEPHERRVAARTIARDARRPDLARSALRDEDPLVRIHAAGAIVAIAPM